MRKSERRKKKKAKRELASILRECKRRGVSYRLREFIMKEAEVFHGLKPIPFPELSPSFLADSHGGFQLRCALNWVSPHFSAILSDM